MPDDSDPNKIVGGIASLGQDAPGFSAIQPDNTVGYSLNQNSLESISDGIVGKDDGGGPGPLLNSIGGLHGIVGKDDGGGPAPLWNSGFASFSKTTFGKVSTFMGSLFRRDRH